MGASLTDVIEDYLENILNVHVDTNDKLVEDNDDTIDEMQEGWDRYIASQNETMSRNQGFGAFPLYRYCESRWQRIPDMTLAAEMAAHLMEMGVAFGDVMGLIDSTGTAKGLLKN